MGGYRVERGRGSGASRAERDCCDADEGEEAGFVPGIDGGGLATYPNELATP